MANFHQKPEARRQWDDMKSAKRQKLSTKSSVSSRCLSVIKETLRHSQITFERTHCFHKAYKEILRALQAEMKRQQSNLNLHEEIKSCIG